eukprot:3107219-Prymnesium_polylepis.1
MLVASDLAGKFDKAALCAEGKVTIRERRSPRGPRSSPTTRASACSPCCTSARTAHRASVSLPSAA